MNSIPITKYDLVNQKLIKSKENYFRLVMGKM